MRIITKMDNIINMDSTTEGQCILVANDMKYNIKRFSFK